MSTPMIPDAVAAKIVRLQTRARDSEFELETTMRNLVQAVEARDHAIHRSLINTINPDEQKRLGEEADKQSKVADALDKKVKELREQVRANNKLVGDADRWLRGLSEHDVVEVIETKQVRGGDVMTEIDSTRQHLLSLDGQLGALRDADKPRSEIKGDIHAWIGALKGKIRPTWAGMGDGIKFVSQNTLHPLNGARQVLAILTYVAPDAVDRLVSTLR